MIAKLMFSGRFTLCYSLIPFVKCTVFISKFVVRVIAVTKRKDPLMFASFIYYLYKTKEKNHNAVEKTLLKIRFPIEMRATCSYQSDISINYSKYTRIFNTVVKLRIEANGWNPYRFIIRCCIHFSFNSHKIHIKSWKVNYRHSR